MLVKELYTIQSLKEEEGIIKSQIHLNPTHEIYKGHFPQQAVLPGVCMMQIVAELTKKGLASDAPIKIQKANQAKFLIPIVPDKNPDLFVTIKYSLGELGAIKVNATIADGTQIFFKFKGTLA